MSNYRIKVQYDGTRYHGWQRQKTGQDTIQGKIESVLTRLYGETVQIDGAGRTDAGVHAKCQIANFRLKENPEPVELQLRMNEYLPEDIRIMEVRQAGERFHSRLNAIGKVYEYHLLKKDCFDVFNRKYSCQMTESLDVERMRQAAVRLVGQHDFRSFCSKASKKKSTVRRIDRIDICEDANNIVLTFEGNGFLYNMVRILTGTLVAVGRGEQEPSWIDELLREGERREAGETAPAQGLFLLQVKYD